MANLNTIPEGFYGNTETIVNAALESANSDQSKYGSIILASVGSLVLGGLSLLSPDFSFLVAPFGLLGIAGLVHFIPKWLKVDQQKTDFRSDALNSTLHQNREMLYAMLASNVAMNQPHPSNGNVGYTVVEQQQQPVLPHNLPTPNLIPDTLSEKFQEGKVSFNPNKKTVYVG